MNIIIDTKLNVGDEMWVLIENKARKLIVSRITVTYTIVSNKIQEEDREYNKIMYSTEISYHTDFKTIKTSKTKDGNEPGVYATRDELIESL